MQRFHGVGTRTRWKRWKLVAGKDSLKVNWFVPGTLVLMATQSSKLDETSMMFWLVGKDVITLN